MLAIDNLYDCSNRRFKTGVEITAPLAGLDKKPVRFKRVIESAEMPDVTLEILG